MDVIRIGKWLQHLCSLVRSLKRMKARPWIVIVCILSSLRAICKNVWNDIWEYLSLIYLRISDNIWQYLGIFENIGHWIHNWCRSRRQRNTCSENIWFPATAAKHFDQTINRCVDEKFQLFAFSHSFHLINNLCDLCGATSISDCIYKKIFWAAHSV